ncbi:MAG: hypothetical protein KatS3mg105_2836 [Gemmatales bacterium]|nr:MAG: hypothetical protein KatS3mg105_2836 [Gemmatales bacterium]
MNTQLLMHVQMSRHGIVSRRGFLRSVSAGAAAAGLLGWKEAVTIHAEELRKQGMACILLFMQGGPSQFETFDPKPGHDNGGPTKAIETAVPGIQIAEHWPEVAKQMKDIALIRSMTNREGAHARAAYQLHTGYVPSGAVKYPSLGSIVANEIGPKDFDLPGFVSIGSRRFLVGAGFLGTRVAPFAVDDPQRMPNNVSLPVADSRFQRRLRLLGDLEDDFASAGGGPRVAEHRQLYDNASRMVRSPRIKAFDISQESDKTRDRYGRNAFGQGCLLARRLVEAGVTFVEVMQNGWDTHQDNFTRVQTLSSQADPALAALIADLKERGRLDKTLIIWMGEFGRTPRINARTGRDHYPRAFSLLLAGGGIKGGQVIGKTSNDGTDVVERPVTVPDLFCTFYRALNINPRKENISDLQRPIKLIEGGSEIKELL